MGIQVAVAGASGYAGGELLRLLAGHPGMELGTVTAASNVGEPVTALHPHLVHLSGRRFEPLDPIRLAAADLVFLALPHGRSADVAAALPDQVKIVDLGADFRLADADAWQRFYGGQHAGRWTYGLPELGASRARITSATRVAVPGCFATAAILALAPLLGSGLIEPSDIVIVAASGTSGAGRAPKPHLLGAEVMGAVSAYQVGGMHRHTPEIEQALTEARPETLRQTLPAARAPAGGTVTVSFTPSLAPMPRGILATCTARLSPRASAAGGAAAGGAAAGGAAAGGAAAGGAAAGGAAAAASGAAGVTSEIGAGVTGAADAAGTTGASVATALLRAALSDAYADEPFVHVLPAGRWPSTAATAGSNAVHLQAAADTRAGRAIVVAAIDNLGKGAAGQAIQNANLMTGLAETAGLTAHGVSP